MVKKRLEIVLDETDETFIKWMAKRSGHTFREELETIFYLQLREDEEYYLDEMREENPLYTGKWD